MAQSELFSIAGKTAIVTGACKGIGAAIARGYVSAGAKVALLDIDEGIDEVARSLRDAGGDVVAIRCDLSDRTVREQAFAESLAFLGGHLDIIVNNAGLQRRYPALEFPLDEWDRVMEVNITAVFDLCQRAGRVMVGQGSGKIINIASVNAFSAGILTAAYCAAKGGVAQLTKLLSNEWSALGINVNAIAPGYIDTPLNVALVNDPDRFDSIRTRIPIDRWGEAGDLVGTAIYLASAASDYVCGTVLAVDGGYLGR